MSSYYIDECYTLLKFDINFYKRSVWIYSFFLTIVRLLILLKNFKLSFSLHLQSNDT